MGSFFAVFIDIHQMDAPLAQEKKRFEEIHRSTQTSRRAALAPALALPTQGRCADRHRCLVPVPDDGLVDLWQG
ncbi:hypothetical protein EMIT0P43_30347 [Pseudomonas jessenii]